jgi:hypothetical protein
MPQLKQGDEVAIKQLVQQFGAEREREIRSVYRAYRLELQRGARVSSFVPILAFSEAKRALKGRRSGNVRGFTEATALKRGRPPTAGPGPWSP